jgi:LmbE family N-acetylglucosaminyl deacetylase
MSLLRVTAVLVACVVFYSAAPAQTFVQSPPSDGKLNIVVFGAHPDDPEYSSGGSGAKWAKQGHHVLLCSVTNGDIGHWQMAGGPLAQRRTAEVAACSKILGTTSLVLDNHDGELEPTLDVRKQIIRVIRQWKADIVISHRPWDYHPDHRYVGVLVQDAAYMVTVPFICPDSPILKKNPVFMYSSDRFQKPYPFKADVAVSIDDVFEQKVNAIHELASQHYEGGANGSEEQMRKVPPASDVAGRKEWLKNQWLGRSGGLANRFRADLISWYGEEKGKAVKNAECFEICEYGRQPDRSELKKLFPFFD